MSKFHEQRVNVQLPVSCFVSGCTAVTRLARIILIGLQLFLDAAYLYIRYSFFLLLRWKRGDVVVELWLQIATDERLIRHNSRQEADNYLKLS